jgi:two-component system LytT family response regulator
MSTLSLNAILVDDEENNILNLQELLKEYCPEVEVLDTARSAMEAFCKIKEQQPDLIFLDVEMPGGSGFDLLAKLAPVKAAVIFITAYDRYAIRAFRFSAVDYLLKPINIFDLQAAVQKVIQQKTANTADEGIDNLLQHHLNPKNAVKKIALPTADQLVYVPVDQILRCEGDNNYTHFYLLDGTHMLVTRTLKEYEELLTCYGFVRSHQSHLVNLQCVKKYVKRDGGYLVMQDDTRVNISRSKKEMVMCELSRL